MYPYFAHHQLQRCKALLLLMELHINCNAGFQRLMQLLMMPKWWRGRQVLKIKQKILSPTDLMPEGLSLITLKPEGLPGGTLCKSAL